jgi:hypothetical protein
MVAGLLPTLIGVPVRPLAATIGVTVPGTGLTR